MTATQVTVTDADDLGRLEVVVPRILRPNLDALLRASGYGGFDGEYAWLNIEALSAARAVSDDTWQERFDSMIRYAGDQGWLRSGPGATTVRAHCVEPA